MLFSGASEKIHLMPFSLEETSCLMVIPIASIAETL